MNFVRIGRFMNIENCQKLASASGRARGGHAKEIEFHS